MVNRGERRSNRHMRTLKSKIERCSSLSVGFILPNGEVCKRTNIKWTEEKLARRDDRSESCIWV
ncbi:MAG: hypothetical protein A4E23_01711 [Methanomethylovorans sp. PtaU1.Bin073]|nr:MAG: hypothetical protein A4E23_01711 [Methanomethylovorans sp. PtaU1.Bin073]